jgi:hypothetical protein
MINPGHSLHCFGSSKQCPLCQVTSRAINLPDDGRFAVRETEAAALSFDGSIIVTANSLLSIQPSSNFPQP